MGQGLQRPGLKSHLEQLFFQLQGPLLELHQRLFLAGGHRLQLRFQSLLQALVPGGRSLGIYLISSLGLALSAAWTTSLPLVLQRLFPQKLLALQRGLLQLILQTLQAGPQLLAPRHSLL